MHWSGGHFDRALDTQLGLDTQSHGRGQSRRALLGDPLILLEPVGVPPGPGHRRH